MKMMSLFVALSITTAAFAGTPEYKAKKKMGEGKFKGTITYLAMGGDMVYALEDSGEVQVFDAESCNRKDHFETGLNNTQAIAVNDKGEIFVFATATRQEQKVYNNRKYNVNVAIGVTCKVFNADGKELRTLSMNDLKSAKAAQFVGDKLVVADLEQRALFFLNPDTGKKTAEVKKGMRLCCGIFDFCIGPDDTVAVANLGAFQVQQYNMDGKLIKSFGKRGKNFDEFQGCCNPVSAGYLADGSIITVEKDPTRIKIYDADGKNARHIDGIENLVEGCSHIPVAIDDEGNIFLAAGRKGYIVKCIPKS